MKNKRIAAFFLAAAMLMLTACQQEKPEHRPGLESAGVVLTPESESSSSEEENSSPEKENSSGEEIPEASSSSEAPENPESSSSEAEEEIPSPGGQGDAQTGGEPVLILVNPWNFIPEDYEPVLEKVQGKYNMDIKAASSARELLSAAEKAGFDMRLCSAYRTVETSERLYNNKVNDFLAAGYSEADAKTEAAKWVAPPGTSEHHTGLAMDLVSADYWNYYSDLEHDYEKFDSFRWLYEHCAEFGFILRYPKDKQHITGITYEPWHYRYVGREAAEYIMENGLCLEEYLEIIK